ncbi:MAG: CoA-binding protein [Bacteroidales bacterium]|nr:CoA-binding protein [Bacteroidales bacterium]
MKKILVVGASLKTERYSNRAIKLLQNYNHEVVAYGLREGEVNGIKITKEKENFTNIHTITIYVNPERQKELYDYILSLNPERIIFNPGTVNKELKKLAQLQNIETVEHCTLVMLRNGIF